MFYGPCFNELWSSFVVQSKWCSILPNNFEKYTHTPCKCVCAWWRRGMTFSTLLALFECFPSQRVSNAGLDASLIWLIWYIHGEEGKPFPDRNQEFYHIILHWVGLHTPQDDFLTLKRFPHYWLVARGIHWPLVHSPQEGPVVQRFDIFFDSAWRNCWSNIREAGELR